ncbi:MAG: formylglycine-generating enzyme family protein [Acidobacteriia bacterium]|nr:formylglycine-generating enzyme family protein [Terriglobia bacterium]
MIRKTIYVLALILVVLALGACGQKQEAQPQAQQAAAVPEKPKVIPGEMVLIPAGEYTIGTNEKDPGDPAKKDFTNAYPEHKVKLPAFWIDKYETTGKEYLEFSIKTSYVVEGQEEGKTWRTFFSLEKPNVPVTYITWKDANEYCKAQGKRLPTEEEWEAAARGPNGYRYPWGNEWDATKANTADAGYRVPVDIGQFDDVSPFGVHDMYGNVQEWASDSYKPYKGNPKAGGLEFNSGYKVLRGLGSRYTGTKSSGLWARTAYLPNYLADFGCRCAKSATPEEAAKAVPAK